MRFEKWHGLRNDFVLVNRAELVAGATEEALAALARRLCDRRGGIGADGLLIIDREPARMTIYNADGSRPEMCGNGLRCVAALLHREGAPKIFDVETDAGRLHVTVDGDAADSAASVEVRMGHALRGISRDAQGLVPEVLADSALGDGRVIDIGNPHWIFIDDGLGDDELVLHGPRMERDERFPDRTNVEFVERLGDRHWRVRVWERGCGITQACGTGATAVAAALCDRGLLDWGEEAEIELPGGPLTIRVDRERMSWMRGPAIHVFTGEVPLSLRVG